MADNKELTFGQDQITALRSMADSIDSDYLKGASLIAPSGYTTMQVKNMLDTGRKLRDSLLQELPILPEAVFIFQQLASNREWVVAGKINRVMRALEWIQDAEAWNVYTGDVQFGFENFLKRQALDYVTLGRTAMAVRQKGGNANPSKSPLEYLDPALLYWNRKKTNRFNKVKPNEKVWRYANNDSLLFKHKEVMLHHPIPIGTGLFAAPLAPVIKTAMLAWLIREHNTASVDGRKIREIFMVSGTNIRGALEDAIKISAAKHAGADPKGNLGIPVIEVQNPNGTPLKDLIATLGLSVIPESFDPDEFNFGYVNEIAGALGLALRHFWQSERTTNKALEEVQEQRQQLKGPAVFTRSVQRTLNRKGGPMDMFSTGRNRTRFAFIEEVDTSTRLNNAQVLKTITEGLEKIQMVFGQSIDLQSYLAWMQAENVLPNELVLIDSGTESTAIRRNSDGSTMAQEGEERVVSDPQPVAVPSTQKAVAEPDYDEVVVDREGHIVEKRVKVFSVSKYMEKEIKAATQIVEVTDHGTDSFAAALASAGLAHQVAFKSAFANGHKDTVNKWVDSQLIFDGINARQAVEKCMAGETLDQSEQNVISAIVQDVLS